MDVPDIIITDEHSFGTYLLTCSCCTGDHRGLVPSPYFSCVGRCVRFFLLPAHSSAKKEGLGTMLGPDQFNFLCHGFFFSVE